MIAMKNLTFERTVRKTFHFFKRNILLIEKWYIRYHLKIGTILSKEMLDSNLNLADKVLLKTNHRNVRVGLVKSGEYKDFNGYIENREYWPKYERFLKNNNINYSFFDIHSSNWQKEAESFDIVIWPCENSPHVLSEAKSKIYFLEKYMKVTCFPSFEELWSYEDKVHASYTYKHFGLPAVDTFTSNSKKDSLQYINKASFPIIAKLSAGSSSCGVEKLNNKSKAINYINTVFSEQGRKTYWQSLKQKNYVYFQKYINDAKFDLRIIVVGNKIFGYYRFAKTGDFRASGSGLVEKKQLPEKAMRIAINAKSLLNVNSLAVDMLFSEKEQQYLIIETSIFFGIDTPEQLIISGKPGYYEYNNDEFIFKEGRFWIQELTLEAFFNSYVKQK
jgi:glutathione synthase/RimK-type ligase-like ATP-grasp enzyme